MTNQLNHSGGVGEAPPQILQKRCSAVLESKGLKTPFDFKKLVAPKSCSDSSGSRADPSNSKAGSSMREVSSNRADSSNSRAIQKEKAEAAKPSSLEDVLKPSSKGKGFSSVLEFPEELEREDLEEDIEERASLSVFLLDPSFSKGASSPFLGKNEDLKMGQGLTMRQLDQILSSQSVKVLFEEEGLNAFDEKGSVQRGEVLQAPLENLGALTPKHAEKLQDLSKKMGDFLPRVGEDAFDEKSVFLGKVSKIAHASILPQDVGAPLNDQEPLDFVLEKKNIETKSIGASFVQEGVGKVDWVQGPAKEIAAQICDKMPWRSLAFKGTHQIKIQLYPEELGEVTVDLKIGDNGRLDATFSAVSSATLEMLRQDASELLQGFKKEGFDVGSDNFQFTPGEGESQNAPQEKGKELLPPPDLSEKETLFSQTWEEKRDDLLSKSFENNKVNILIH